MTTRRRAAGLLALLALLTAAAPAFAHTRSRSSSFWVESDNGDVSVVVTAAAREWTRVADVAGSSEIPVEDAARHVDEALGAASDAGPCRAVEPARARLDERSRIVVTRRFHCGEGRLARLRLGLFAGLPGLHVHLARLERADGRLEEFVVSDPPLLVDFDDAPSGLVATVTTYIGLGWSHVLFGPDHLAFVLALVLGAASFGSAVAAVTGFTLGHATTITLAALGTIGCAEAPVEVLIAASVVAVAVEAGDPGIAWRRRGTAAVITAGLVALALAGGAPRNATAVLAAGLLAVGAAGLQGIRPGVAVLVTAVFGLVHGLGFAGALAETGLPEAHALPALLGFNLGVEAAQILVVAFVAAGLCRLRPGHLRRIPLLASWGGSLLAGLGTTWLLTRLLH